VFGFTALSVIIVLPAFFRRGALVLPPLPPAAVHVNTTGVLACAKPAHRGSSNSQFFLYFFSIHFIVYNIASQRKILTVLKMVLY
jgi:hypothetical protein